MSIRTIIFNCFFLVIAVPILFAQSDSFDTDSFAMLSEEEKQAFVLAVLQNRDAQLQNFSYEMSHRLERFTPLDGKKQFMDEASIGIKRKGKKLLLTAEKLDSKKRLQKYLANWDGTTAKSLLHRPYRKITNSGLIKDQEDNNFTYRAFNHILGLRLLDTPKLTLNEWFNEAMTKGESIDIDVVEENGKSLLMFKVTVGNKYWQWFLDADRDYMPIRADIRYERGEDFNSDSSVVEEARQVDGFWVPKKVFRRTGTSISDGQGENTYETSTFTRNTVTDEDLIIDFPVGTEVVDTIAKIAYRVLPNGNYEILPLLNSETGELIEPIKPTIDDAIEDAHKEVMAGKAPAETLAGKKPKEATASQVSEEPQTPPKPPVPIAETKTTPNWLWLGILILVIGVLFVYGGIKLFVRRNPKKNL